MMTIPERIAIFSFRHRKVKLCTAALSTDWPQNDVTEIKRFALRASRLKFAAVILFLKNWIFFRLIVLENSKSFKLFQQKVSRSFVRRLYDQVFSCMTNHGLTFSVSRTVSVFTSWCWLCKYPSAHSETKVVNQ
jgi:hypothetical protein